MNNRKRKASGRVPLSALLSPQRSIVLVDLKGELAAVTANRVKKNGGVMTLNPFVVLPQRALENYSKWFRLCAAAAISDLTKAQRKEGNERQQQRKSQRAD